MKIDHIIPSTLKVTASEDLKIEEDLQKEEPQKTLAQILHEEKETKED